MFNMYDSINPDLIPAGLVGPGDYVALYRNGRFAATPEQAARWDNRFFIDVIGDAADECSIADIETGDMTVDEIPPWCERRHSEHPRGMLRIYVNLGNWPAARLRVAELQPEVIDLVRWWVANPTGSPHIVPGSDATQWLWQGSYDQSLCHETFLR